MSPNHTTVAHLELAEVARILRRHKGSLVQIADALGVRGTAITLVIDGKSTSARIAQAARLKALELLEIESRTPPTSTTAPSAA